MAGKPPKLKIYISPQALNTLDEIWDWNSTRYNVEHAQKYVDFIKSKVNKLSTTYLTGKTINAGDELRYIIIKRNPRGHGHIAVYEVKNDAVYILNFYHTAQDWRGKIIKRE